MKQQTEIDRKAAELAAQFDTLARRLVLQNKSVRKDDIPLTRQEFRVILALGERQAWMMSELAERMMLAVSTLTSLVDKLVARNLLRRERFDEDRRVVLVAFTVQGRRLFDRCRRNRLRIARAMLGSLNEQEQDDFLELIRKIAYDSHASDRAAETAAGPRAKP